MEATSVGFGLAELLLLLMSGPMLGLPPGERDPLVLQSAPAASYFYCEWASSGPGVAGAPGIEGLIADPEILSLLAVIETALATPNPDAEELYGEIEQSLREELPKLLLLMAKHPGGLYIAGREAPPGASPLLLMEAAWIMNLGDDLPVFRASLNRVLSLIPGYTPAQTLDGATIPLPGVTMTLHEVERRLIVTIGDGTLDGIQARWKESQAELSESPAFTQAWNSGKVERVGSIAWWNAASLRDDLQRKFGLTGKLIHGMAESLGLSRMNSVLMVSGLNQQDMVGRTQVTLNGKPDGLLTLVSGRALTPADFSHVPGDADFVAAISLHLSTVHRTVREIVAKTAPDVLGTFDEFHKQLEQELQLQLDDIQQGFGDVWTVYDAPSNGGLALTGLVAAVPVRDANRAAAVYQRLMDLLAESLPPGADGEGTSLKDISFGGETIHYLNSSGFTVRYEGQPPISPAFCLTKQQVLVALHPQALKAHLRFLESSEPRFESLLKEKLPGLAHGEPLAALYVDTPRIARAIYPLIPLLAKPSLAELQAQGVPFDMASIPSARAVLPYLQGASAVVVRQPQGLLIEQRNTLPIMLSVLLLPRWSESFEGSMEHDGMLPLEGSHKATLGAPAVQLGAAEGVVPAKAEEPAKPAPKEPSALENAARRTVPFMVRELIPDDIEAFIPSTVFERLAQPPDPEKAAERAAERQRRREARAAKRAARLAK